MHVVMQYFDQRQQQLERDGGHQMRVPSPASNNQQTTSVLVSILAGSVKVTKKKLATLRKLVNQVRLN